MALDQLRSRHGDPAINFSLDDVKRITKWMPIPMLWPGVTVRPLTKLLARTKSSSLYHDGVTHSILANLSDDMLAVIVQIINACFTTGNPYDIPEAIFEHYAKRPPTVS